MFYICVLFFCKVAKILIIRFSSIGDIVLTSPVIRSLKHQVPKSEIHVLTKEAYRFLFDPNPHVAKVFALGKDNKLGKLIQLLKTERYDYVIDLHNNLRSWRVRIGLAAKSYGFTKLNLRKYFLVRLKFNIMPDIHIVDRYFEAVKKLKVKNDGRGLDYYFLESADFQLNQLPETHRMGFIAVVIGGQHATKIFPVIKLLEVIPLLDMPVVLLGGKEDMERATIIQQEIGDKVFNLSGKVSLDVSAALIKQAKAVLTNDTGLMHIAAAFRKPIVSVWGNTVPELGMYPYMPGDECKSVIVQNDNLSCRPCSKIGFDACPKSHFKCMMDLNSKNIASSLNRLANKKSDQINVK